MGVAGVLAWLPVASLRAEINLVWRPALVGTAPGQIIHIELYAVSDTGFHQSFSGISALFGWDPTHLELLGFTEPCTQKPCPSGTYDWLQSWFPDDSKLEGINDDLLDGEAFFQTLGRLGLEHLPAATPGGLHVTTFQFQVLESGTSAITLIPEIGVSRTRVAGGELPGLDVTGVLGPPVQVIARSCDPPEVSGSGARYLSVTAAPGDTAIALRVAGATGEASVSCVDRFVQPDGSLGSVPVFRIPNSWATIQVHGEAIQPGTTWSVQAECAAEVPGLLLSTTVTATTWRWGDTNGDGLVSFTDVTRVIDAAEGIFPPETTLYAVDLAPCEPDGIVNDEDVNAALEALSLHPFPCAAPCVTTSLEQLFDFVACLDGPNAIGDESCAFFDFDSDLDVDMVDFGFFARRISGSSP